VYTGESRRGLKVSTTSLKKPSEMAHLGLDFYHPTNLISREEDDILWVLDTIHAPRPLKPLDGYWAYVAGEYSMAWASKNLNLPVAQGIYWRLVNGWVYIAPAEITDPEQIKRREAVFREKLDHYFKNWNDIWSRYLEELKGYINEMESWNLETEPPEYSLLVKFDKLWQYYLRSWEIHMELLYPTQVSFLAFRSMCKELIPDIDEDTISKLVAGLGNAFIEADEQYWRLSQRAIELGVADVIKSLPPTEALAKLKETDNGRRWLNEMEEVLKVYGNRSYGGPGINLTECPWRERPEQWLPIAKGLIERIERGEKFRPKEEILKEREEAIKRCLAKIPSDEDKARFQEMLKIIELTYAYNEDHNYWIDCYVEELIHLKLVELGRRFAKHGYIEDDHDVFFLKPEEVRTLLYEMLCKENGIRTWNKMDYKALIARRKREYEEMLKWRPPLVLNPEKIPSEIKEPFFVMLWGYTAEALREWGIPIREPEKVVEIKGYPGSPGVAEGVARVILDVAELGQFQTGEILVTRLTTPAWTSVFAKAKAVVTDIGGVMSHAAITAREYGIPAVVGAGRATEVIKSGDRLRVDGTSGVVKIYR